jgi:hypothetical protein
MAAQQPNFVTLSQHLIGASTEIALVPNVPPIAVQVQLQQVLQQLGQMGAQVGQMGVQVGQVVAQLGQMGVQVGQVVVQLGGVQQQLNDLQAGCVHSIDSVHAADAAYRQDLLPMRLRNATASLDAPLHYPPNVVVPAQAPQTKQALLSMTGVCPFYWTFSPSNINYAIEVSSTKPLPSPSTSLFLMPPLHNAANKL